MAFPRGGPGTAGGIPVFNVVANFGAFGNGIHNDAPNIQNAINAAQAAGGGIVYFPTGTYLIGSGLTVTTSGITLRGAGIEATVILEAAASTFDAVSITGANTNGFTSYLVGCGIEHLAIRRAAATTSTAVGLSLKYVMFLRVDDVYIYNFGTGLYISAGLSNYLNRVQITGYNNNVAAMIGFHISSAQGQQSTLRLVQCSFEADYPQNTGLSTFTPINAGGTSTGYQLDGGGGIQDVMVTECEANNCSTSLVITGSGSGAQCFDVHFSDFAAGDGGSINITGVTSARGGAIDFDGGILTNTSAIGISGSSGITIRGMQFYGNGTGIAISAGSSDITVKDCVVRGCTTAFVTIDASSYIKVNDNTLIGSGIGVKFTSASSNCIVNGNTMNGITASNAVNIAAGCGPITCVGNAWGGASNYTDTPGTNTFTANI